jgi:dTDP-4-amino-4,6-dideoxygalactose transaminase
MPPVDTILAIHLYASQVDIPALRKSFPGIPVVEDCSHCHGAVSANGQPLGSFGDLAIFSFQATKVLPAGEGGAVVTDDEGMAARLFALATDSRRLASLAPLDALNRLEPAGSLHGANHAMSEFSAAVLWAQLLRLAGFAARRADGLAYFASQLDPQGGTLVFDEASASSGGLYGVPFLPAHSWPNGIGRVIAEMRNTCGARLDRVYPPIPVSPLYRPWTVPSYRRDDEAPYTEELERSLPNSLRWHRNGIVLPHPLFLADRPALRALACAVNAHTSSRRISRVPAQPAGRPARADQREVCVVVLTTGRRATLTEALHSLREQTYRGPCSVLILLDRQDEHANRLPNLVAAAAMPDEITVRTISLTLCPGSEPGDLFSRVALLRNIALGYVTAPLIAFLDDDNVWEPDHLTSLTQLMAETHALAVHSWRRLVTPQGTPQVPDTFPWLMTPDAAAARFALLTKAGVLQPGSEIVRDRSSLNVLGREYGMVDMGEWLFDRRLFSFVRFDTQWTGEQLIDCVGEDDKLLQQLRELLIPVHCTERATLRYRLGGFSNAFALHQGRSDSH